MEHGLSLLREYANMRACYWICPFCPTPEGRAAALHDGKDFLTHVDACHEGRADDVRRPALHLRRLQLRGASCMSA